MSPGKRSAGSPPAGEARARLAVAGPFDAAWLEAFLAARAVPGLERFEGGEYVRTLSGSGSSVGIRFAGGSEGRGRGSTLDGAVVTARSFGSLDAGRLVAAVARLFDLAAPPVGFLAAAAADPVLAPLASRRPGLRLPIYDDPFEGLVRAILGQQVSVAAARTIGGRLVERFGRPAPPLGGAPLRFFPTPEALAAAGRPALRALGLTGAKTATLQGAADAVASGRLDLEALRSAPPDEADAALRALSGIGPWTAAYVRLRALGDRDAFPAGDLGVRKALAGASGKLPSERDVERRAAAWRPWRGYATLHLWAGLE
ncbi:MAG TPA: DNA-3-methyladenine glycosylase [Thermoanaerobaculia bacterium]|nr:DNA-3-methyladenine glycosylase [Thermoanaerobaculia bacterium]